jgi:hypothetical protein
MAYGEGTSRRLWSSHPDIWPPGGDKPLPTDSELFRVVVGQGLPRLLDGAEAMQAAVNIPVRHQGRTLGALNLLHQARHYAGLDLSRLVALADGAAPLLMLGRP